MKIRRNFDFEESNQQFWPCGYQLLSCRNEMQIQEKIKQWMGIEQDEMLHTKIPFIETFEIMGGFECTEKVVDILFR